MLECSFGEKTHLGILREKEARAWRRSDFGEIYSHSSLLNDQASWLKEIHKGFKVRNKPHITLNEVWVRETLIHPWVLLMVGLGWYLMSLGVIPMICFGF